MKSVKEQIRYRHDIPVKATIIRSLVYKTKYLDGEIYQIKLLTWQQLWSKHEIK